MGKSKMTLLASIALSSALSHRSNSAPASSEGGGNRVATFVISGDVGVCES